MISQSKRQTIKFLRITLSNSDSLFSSSCVNIKNLAENSICNTKNVTMIESSYSFIGIILKFYINKIRFHDNIIHYQKCEFQSNKNLLILFADHN